MKSMAVPQKSPLHVGYGVRRFSCRCSDARWRLGRQIELESLYEKLPVGVQFSVAAQDQCASIGGREVDVEHASVGVSDRIAPSYAPKACRGSDRGHLSPPAYNRRPADPP